MILQDTLNPEGILYFKNVMDADILRSVVEGRSSIINYFYVFFKRSRETVFSTNKRVTAGREGAATHVAVVGHYAAMMLSAGCSDATGFPFPNNQPGTLMMLNSGCHLRKEKKKSNDKYVNFMSSSMISGKVGPWAKKLMSAPFSLRLTHHFYNIVILLLVVVVVLIVLVLVSG